MYFTLRASFQLFKFAPGEFVGAKMLCDNLNALTVYTAEPNANDGTDRKVITHQINRTYGFALMKRYLPRWLLRGLPGIDALTRIFAELRKHWVRFLPEQSKPRPKRSTPHYYKAYKSMA